MAKAATRHTSGGTTESTTATLKALVFLMFAAFAMTTDSVGTVIPQIIRDFGLGLTAAGTFQYATMSGIGLSAIALGFLADRIGRRNAILAGLVLFCGSCALFAFGHDFGFFALLLFVGGIGIGIFKAAALALIGDISTSTREHARTMNLIEAFFGVGAIVGPAIVAGSLAYGASWKLVYLFAAALCALLIAGALLTRFPATSRIQDQDSGRQERTSMRTSLRLLGDPMALFFAVLLMLYVGAEAAIYVWAPTYFAGYEGTNAWLVGYTVSLFFVLRAGGRFLGAWLLQQFDWMIVLASCSSAVALLFWLAVLFGRDVAAFALPATGLFMSVLYPTINSTGISCFPRQRHGSIAGLLLFFTCISAVLAPLAMGLIGDLMGTSVFSIVLGGVFATLLAGMCVWNALAKPAAARLVERNRADYAAASNEELASQPSA
ncbi:MFS transporter [Sphingomonas endolithica]|uniref:MFS transporter n=1 Tax=Sphingomonas endolithica TaxID=2972485 RepID=UPI0021AFF556|nr:MFS transporter [Sphingomonas sp. ZFBP2030]